MKNLNTTKIAGAEAAHFFSLRVKEGQRVTLTDLQGNRHQVQLIETDKKKQKIAWEILSTQKVDKPQEKILFQAWPDKQYLDKLAEVAGFSSFTKIYFFAGDYSPKQNLNLERLEKILTRACELAERAWKPELEIIDSSKVNELLTEHRPTVLEHKQESSKESPTNSNACLIGPEGGWSPTEINHFEELQLPFQNLGQTVYPAWLAGFVWDQQISVNNEQ